LYNHIVKIIRYLKALFSLEWLWLEQKCFIIVVNITVTWLEEKCFIIVVNITDWFPLFFPRYHAQLLFERLAHLNPVEHIEICDGLFRFVVFLLFQWLYFLGLCSLTYICLYFSFVQNDWKDNVFSLLYSLSPVLLLAS